MDQEEIYFNFLLEQEGFKLDGYVPCQNGVPLGKSGVTIATGFDIGQLDLDELNKMELSQNLKKKYSPYVGKKKEEAIKFLKDNPLKITEQEANETNRAVLKFQYKPFKAKFQKFLPQLTKGQKTAIFSIAYQYGLYHEHINKILEILAIQDGVKKVGVYIEKQANDPAQIYKTRWRSTLKLYISG